MRPIELTHAVHRTELGTPSKVYVYPQHVFAIIYMPNLKAVAVQTHAGAYQAVLETEQEIIDKIEQAQLGIIPATGQTQKEGVQE